MGIYGRLYIKRRKAKPAGLELKEQVVTIKRVTKVVKGGRRFSFAALVVVGNGEGVVGFGLGKAKEVVNAISKGVADAKKNLIRVPIIQNRTVPHEIEAKYGATQVIIKPAAPGSGIIAGGAMRPLLEAAGYKDLICKVVGSSNQHNVIKATIKALLALHMPHEVSELRNIPLEKLFNG